MKKKSSQPDILIVAASELDANLYYTTQFLAPDPFVFFRIRGKKYLLMSDLEVDRAHEQSSVDQVVSTSRLAREFRQHFDRRPGYVDLIEFFARKHQIKKFLVPANFPIEFADPLRKRKFKIEFKSDPFFEERTVKSPWEIRAIESAISHVETAVELAIKTLRKSVIKKGKLYYHGEKLTSEAIKKIINVSLMQNDCIAAHSIVACGEQAVDPHNQGSGPLYAHQSIIMDIFPRASQSRYFADFTRTVVRGKASVKLKKMFEAVREGQEIAFRTIREGTNGEDVHKAIHKKFEDQGFKTGMINGRMQGFFHGTGHGLGLDIHEEPSVSIRKDILKAGNVVTVEPGLYYEGIGGIRLEDVIVVTKTGNRNLTRYPKFLEI